MFVYGDVESTFFRFVQYISGKKYIQVVWASMYSFIQVTSPLFCLFNLLFYFQCPFSSFSISSHAFTSCLKVLLSCRVCHLSLVSAVPRYICVWSSTVTSAVTVVEVGKEDDDERKFTAKHSKVSGFRRCSHVHRQLQTVQTTAVLCTQCTCQFYWIEWSCLYCDSSKLIFT